MQVIGEMEIKANGEETGGTGGGDTGMDSF